MWTPKTPPLAGAGLLELLALAVVVRWCRGWVALIAGYYFSLPGSLNSGSRLEVYLHHSQPLDFLPALLLQCSLLDI